jgi:hypothetical protein
VEVGSVRVGTFVGHPLRARLCRAETFRIARDFEEHCVATLFWIAMTLAVLFVLLDWETKQVVDVRHRPSCPHPGLPSLPGGHLLARVQAWLGDIEPEPE